VHAKNLLPCWSRYKTGFPFIGVSICFVDTLFKCLLVAFVNLCFQQTINRGDKRPTPWHIVPMEKGTSLPAVLKLDEQEARFVAEMAQCGDLATSVVNVGYKASNPKDFGRRLMRRPQVLAALQIEVARLLLEDSAVGRTVARKLMEDVAVNPKIRADLALRFMNMAGHIAPRARQAGDGPGKSLHEMSIEELRETQDRLQNEILSRAKVIAAPSGVDTQADDTDLMG
jgi:Phage terminase, small subunit